MCTVTYIPATNNGSFVLTSNRDEKEARPTLAPEIYSNGTSKLVFPKDEKAGGSWIAVNNSGNINCLLNGGLVAHQKQDNHTQSRGTILLDFTRSALATHEYFAHNNLQNVEPFTIVALKHNNGTLQNFTEFIWDGNNKHFRELDKQSPYIWSSVTLYNAEHRKTRKAWFEQFYKEHYGDITKEKIVDFHSGNHTSDKSVNVIMQRGDGLKTVSITQVSITNNKANLTYFDLLNASVKEIEL